MPLFTPPVATGCPTMAGVSRAVPWLHGLGPVLEACGAMEGPEGARFPSVRSSNAYDSQTVSVCAHTRTRAHIVEYYSATKKEKKSCHLQRRRWSWGVVLREVSQSEKDNYQVLTHMWD